MNCKLKNFISKGTYLRRQQPITIHHHPVFQDIHVPGFKRSVEFNDIGLWNFRPGIRQSFAKLVIIREQKESRGILIEPSDGEDPCSQVAEKVVNCFSSPLV